MKLPRLVISMLVPLLVTAMAAATETRRWIVDTAEELLEGRGSDVQITADGVVQRIAGWAAGPEFEEAVVMAAARGNGGKLIVGTGFPGRLYSVRGDRAELLTDVPAEQITALLAIDDGSVLIATVVPGKVFRWARNSLEEVGSVTDGGLWDLTLFNGEVVAAGGPPASIFKVADQGLVRGVELPDVHAR